MVIRVVSFALALALYSAAALAQTATVTRNVNLLPDPSTNQPSIKLLTPGEQLTLVSAKSKSGYYHVKVADGAEGWVWGRNIQLSAAARPTATPSGHPLTTNCPAAWRLWVTTGSYQPLRIGSVAT